MYLRTGLGAALNLLGLGTGDVVGGDPIGVVGCGRRSSSAGGGLFGDRGLNCTLRSTLFASLSAGFALLGEVRSDPDSVEEITGSNDTGEEEEVEENAGKDC